MNNKMVLEGKNFSEMAHIRSLFLWFFWGVLGIFLLLPVSVSASQDVRGGGLGGSKKEIKSDALIRDVPIPVWVDQTLRAGEAISDSPAIVRVDDTQLYVDKESTVFVHKMIQVNEPAMLNKVGQVEISLHPEYQKLALHVLQIHRGGQVLNKISIADIRFLQREQDLDVGVLTGTLTASIVVDDIRVGDVLDISYSVIGQNPVFSNLIAQFFSWDGNFTTQQKRVILNAPEGRDISYRILGKGETNIRVKETKLDGRKITKFLGENLPPVEFELYTPSDIDQYRQIQFSEYKNWQQVASWANGLFTENQRGGLLEQVTADMLETTDKEVSIQKALSYVQREIRYLSVSIGENSHRPYPPEVVLARRYGDCKDKAGLLVAMLRQLGIDATPVLVSTYYRKNLSRMLPSPLVFDHAIVAVELNGRRYFLDPTRNTQYGSLQALGQIHYGNDVLIVSPTSDRLDKVPDIIQAALPGNRLVERAVLRKIGGIADITAIYYFEGLEAESLRNYLAQQSKDQVFKSYRAFITSHYPNAEMVVAPSIIDSKGSNTLAITLHYEVPHFLEKKAAIWTARYFPSNLQDRFFVPQNTRRLQPLQVLMTPSYLRYLFEFVLSKEFEGKYTPALTQITNTVFEFEENRSFVDNVFKVSINLKVKRDRVSPSEVASFASDVRKLNQALNGVASFGSDDLKEGNISQLLDSPLKQRQMESQQELIAAKTKTINALISQDQEKFDALCARGVAYARIGKKMEALDDMAQLTKIDGASRDLNQCRSQILYFTGDMKASANLYLVAMKSRELTGIDYFQAGLAEYSLGKWKEAAEKFRKSYEEYADEKDKCRAEVMRVFALRHLNNGKTPSSLHVAQDDWPGIALSAALNLRTEDQILRQIHRSTGDDLDIMLAEAYFYFGQLNVLAGNKVKAIVYFQRSLDKGLLTNNFRPVAAIEIERLRR